MNPDEFRRTATCQILVDLIIKYLQQQRAEILSQTDVCGAIHTDEARAASNRLDQIDHVLAELGPFDTKRI